MYSMSQSSESESDDTSIHSDPFFALSSAVWGNDGTTAMKNSSYNFYKYINNNKKKIHKKILFASSLNITINK